MNASTPAIEIENLGKTYRAGFWRTKSRVLEGVSFTVPQGQIFGFLGANGAGKTTTIKIALGLQSADEGRTKILGFNSDDVRSKERIGYLPERPYFQNNLSANEFLDFHRGLFGQKRGRQTNEELLRLVGLPAVGERLLSSFSKGMLQRIGIAQSLVNDPELVILDEPMSGLDPVGRREVRNLILELNRHGKTIFFSSHILSDVEALCQRIAFVERGKLKYSGRVDELLAQGEKEFEIILKVSNPEVMKGLGQWGMPQPAGESYRLLVHGPDVAKKVVESYWAAGAQVLSFAPVQKSLEEALFGEKK